ncbi:DUF4179 domain-containing protein [Evansella cellulosilytica]|uniref:Zinc-finger domain-containing protein n=1 Tax=Evansella cellulosilytica (strain ATCC 21833 / DSM 2522 / FERM P-1141 / JCM 9156 / N-4) TaxID=649639 RepID=E6TWQ7_EVAC2|nr:DUF4179 domain-containing protein [Evansella cellulosilytica]ADU28740.1 hypothetical protein Bcell_0458 [Evansella cellulosilytica DSM 2522]
MTCKKVEDRLLDYLDGNLPSEQVSEIKNHVQTCSSCANELKKLVRAKKTIELESDKCKVPNNFFSNVEARVNDHVLAEGEQGKRNWGINIAIALIGFIVISSFFITEGIVDMSGWWDKDREYHHLERAIEEGYGEQLNISVQDNGIEVTITEIIADELQTVLYYEIRDVEEQNHLTPVYEKIVINNEKELWPESLSYYSGLEGFSAHAMNNTYYEDENFNRGKLTYIPLEVDSGKIEISISELTFVDGDETEWYNTPSSTDLRTVEGDWSFDVPVKKHGMREYDLGEESFALFNNEIILKSLSVAPSNTILQLEHKIDRTNDEKEMQYFSIEAIKVNGKRFERDKFSHMPMTMTSQGDVVIAFDTIYFEEITDVEIILDQVSFLVHENIEIPIDPQDPMVEYNYNGTNISIIDVIEDENYTTIVLEEETHSTRQHEILFIEGFDQFGNRNTISSSLPIIIDQDGNEYTSEYFFKMDELDGAKMFVKEYMLQFEKRDGVQPVINKLVINGHRETILVDEVWKVENLLLK